MKPSIEKLRVEYGNTPLLEENLSSDPIQQFENWLQNAIIAEVLEPNGMVLSTITQLGRPSSRTVLLKGIDQKGFLFFTNLKSRKSNQLQEHPYAALTFWWKEIYRQVNIEGTVKRASREEAHEYFKSRPRGAQIAACASCQSDPLSSRLELEERVMQFSKKFETKEVACPKDWGGWRVIPERVEFWQGRQDRLHDRFLYVKVGKDWIVNRLYP